MNICPYVRTLVLSYLVLPWDLHSGARSKLRAPKIGKDHLSVLEVLDHVTPGESKEHHYMLSCAQKLI